MGEEDTQAKRNMDRLKPLDELPMSSGFAYQVATKVIKASKFIDLAEEHLPRYKGDKTLARTEMRLLYSCIGGEWYQRARQAEALRVFAEMRDKGSEEGAAISAARHWAEHLMESNNE